MEQIDSDPERNGCKSAELSALIVATTTTRNPASRTANVDNGTAAAVARAAAVQAAAV